MRSVGHSWSTWASVDGGSFNGSGACRDSLATVRGLAAGEGRGIHRAREPVDGAHGDQVDVSSSM